jgi:glycosyltransferase involved in cell wall biosynthesis
VPRVSVIIPTFNRENRVGIAIQSVLDQTYQDLEIIVCDDGSTDKTVEVLTSIQKKSKLPVRIEVLPYNLGVSAARNKAIYLSEGELIAFLDSDDSWKPEKLEKQIRFLDRNPEFIGVGCNVELLNKPSNTNSQIGSNYLLDSSKELFQLLYECCIVTSCFLVKKEALILAGLFDLRLKKSEDRDLWWRLPRLGRIGYLNEPLVKYLVHEANISNMMNNETGETYIPAIKRTIWYWRDKLTAEEIRKIYSISHLMVALDVTGRNYYFLSVRHAVTAMLYGNHIVAATKLIISRTISLFR